MKNCYLGTVLAIALLGQTSARAQLQTRVTGRVAVGVTDNVDSTNVGSQADGFTELEPGIALYFGGVRAAHQLEYSIAVALFFARFSSNSTVTNRLDWISLFHLSDAVRLRLTASGSIGQMNLANLGRSAGSSGTPGGFVSGSEWFGSGSVAQGLDWEISRGLTLGQTIDAAVFAPFTDTQPQTYDVAAGIGILRAWESFSLGLQARQGLAVSTAYTPPPPPPDRPDLPVLGPQPQLKVMLTRLTASYEQQLAQSWSLDLIGGAVRAAQLKQADAQLFSPAVFAALRYAQRGLEASAAFEHTVRQSLFVGEAMMSQEARLRLRLPIGRARPTRWFAEGTIGYDHGQLLDLDGLDDASGDEVSKVTANHLHSALLDLGGSWRMNDSLEWSLRYQFSQQWIVGDVPAAQPFSRHLVLVAARFGYPPARIRRRSPRERHQMNPEDWQRFFDPEGTAPAGADQRRPANQK